jgi:hypothetical protein
MGCETRQKLAQLQRELQLQCCPVLQKHYSISSVPSSQECMLAWARCHTLRADPVVNSQVVQVHAAPSCTILCSPTTPLAAPSSSPQVDAMQHACFHHMLDGGCCAARTGQQQQEAHRAQCEQQHLQHASLVWAAMPGTAHRHTVWVPEVGPPHCWRAGGCSVACIRETCRGQWCSPHSSGCLRWCTSCMATLWLMLSSVELVWHLWNAANTPARTPTCS